MSGPNNREMAGDIADKGVIQSKAVAGRGLANGIRQVPEQVSGSGSLVFVSLPALVDIEKPTEADRGSSRAKVLVLDGGESRKRVDGNLLGMF
jgi:hypothetical protein